MKKKNDNLNPIFYKNIEEVNKPVHNLIEDLRNDISLIRGKISDIRHIYGWDDRFEHIEGGLTCLLVAMFSVKEEIKDFEIKNKV